MMQQKGASRSLQEVVEDHALNRVPEAERKSGWSLSWLTVGIGSTLVSLYTGSVVAAIAGMKLAVVADVLMAAFGGTLGLLVANISRREGVSSTVTARFYGFGVQGSVVASLIFSFMILGFLALENILLYSGTIFALGWSDTAGHRILILGILTLFWIALTTFGVNQVLRVSSYLTIAFLVLLAFVFVQAGFHDGASSVAALWNRGPLLPGQGGPLTRFSTAVVTLAGSAGALALVDADYARYAQTQRDVRIMAYVGSFALDVVIMIVGAVVVLGGMGPAIHYVIAHHLATTKTAQTVANGLAANNPGAFFIILSAWVGFVLMYAAQAKAQVLNTYSGSLALANLFDVVGRWRPGRFAMVVLGNLIALAMIAGGILNFFLSFLNLLGILTIGFVAVMIADYYIVRHSQPAAGQVEAVNVAGMVAIALATAGSLILESAGVFPLGFLSALVIVLIAYPVLRRYVFRTGFLSSMLDVQEALKEEA